MSSGVAGLADQSVLIIGRPSGIAGAIVTAAREVGAKVVIAGRDKAPLDTAYGEDPDITTEVVDLTDEGSIAALAERLGTVDRIVSTASARARGKLADLDRDAIRLSFDTKVIGPLFLAKHSRRA